MSLYKRKWNHDRYILHKLGRPGPYHILPKQERLPEDEENRCVTLKEATAQAMAHQLPKKPIKKQANEEISNKYVIVPKKPVVPEPEPEPELEPELQEIANQHVIGCFSLEFDRSKEDRVVITATPLEPTLPKKKPVAPEEDELHELIICDTEGKVLKRTCFLESEYQELLAKSMDDARLSEQDKPKS
ncbi:hypothetical protein KR074_012319 [Drosophila pseudoananassae]|nr:hypothetical protein KR074_012319 [Drosophila pseudoananassae]